jgi:glycosyltransferase involved in cell wall biosynthesis
MCCPPAFRSLSSPAVTARAFRRSTAFFRRPLALFVGRVAHEKNIGFLLEALVHARQLRPDVLLVVAGEGPAMDDLKAQVKTSGLRDSVQFIGYLDRKQALPIAMPPPMPSSLPRVPKRRVWCCWRRWRPACR